MTSLGLTRSQSWISRKADFGRRSPQLAVQVAEVHPALVGRGSPPEHGDGRAPPPPAARPRSASPRRSRSTGGEEVGADEVLDGEAVVQVEQEGPDAERELRRAVRPCADRRLHPSSELAAMELWVPAKATSSTRRSHSSTKLLQPASSMFLRSRSGARTARTKDMPPSSRTRENVATPVVPPRARRRGVNRRGTAAPVSPATHDDAPTRSNTQTVPSTTKPTAPTRTSDLGHGERPDRALGLRGRWRRRRQAPWPGDRPAWPVPGRRGPRAARPSHRHRPGRRRRR